MENPAKERKWLSLGSARDLLDINEATLRQWADNGLVRAFRTPGGHRRFSAEDLNAIIENGAIIDNGSRTALPAAVGAAMARGSSVLPGIRRSVHGSHHGAPQWLAGFDAGGQERMRALGRALLDLCLEHCERPARPESLREASVLGRDYGTELADREVPLHDAVQGFVFFRNATLEGIKASLLRSGISPEELSRCWQRLSRLTDEVLLSLTQVYDETAPRNGGEGPSPKEPTHR